MEKKYVWAVVREAKEIAVEEREVMNHDSEKGEI